MSACAGSIYFACVRVRGSSRASPAREESSRMGSTRAPARGSSLAAPGYGGSTGPVKPWAKGPSPDSPSRCSEESGALPVRYHGPALSFCGPKTTAKKARSQRRRASGLDPRRKEERSSSPSGPLGLVLKDPRAGKALYQRGGALREDRVKRTPETKRAAALLRSVDGAGEEEGRRRSALGSQFLRFGRPFLSRASSLSSGKERRGCCGDD